MAVQLTCVLILIIPATIKNPCFLAQKIMVCFVTVLVTVGFWYLAIRADLIIKLAQYIAIKVAKRLGIHP